VDMRYFEITQIISIRFQKSVRYNIAY